MCVTSFHLGSPFHFLLLVLALTAFYNFSCSLGYTVKDFVLNTSTSIVLYLNFCYWISQVQKALEQMTRGVDWGNLDILVMDMPPGTGDVQIAMSQNLQLSGSLQFRIEEDCSSQRLFWGITCGWCLKQNFNKPFGPSHCRTFSMLVFVTHCLSYA